MRPSRGPVPAAHPHDGAGAPSPAQKGGALTSGAGMDSPPPPKFRMRLAGPGPDALAGHGNPGGQPPVSGADIGTAAAGNALVCMVPHAGFAVPRNGGRVDDKGHQPGGTYPGAAAAADAGMLFPVLPARASRPPGGFEHHLFPGGAGGPPLYQPSGHGTAGDEHIPFRFRQGAPAWASRSAKQRPHRHPVISGRPTLPDTVTMRWVRGCPCRGVRHSGGGGHVGHQHPGLGGQYPRPQLPSQYRLDELALPALGVTVRQHDHPARTLRDRPAAPPEAG